VLAPLHPSNVRTGSDNFFERKIGRYCPPFCT
jgi:hypothetical protein